LEAVDVRHLPAVNDVLTRDAVATIGVTAQFLYAALAAAQWAHAARWLYRPLSGLWCGNVIIDPYLIIMNGIVPAAAILGACAGFRCIQTGRYSLLGGLALFLFLATTAALLFEGRWLDHDLFGGDHFIRRGIFWLEFLREA
jgi:hypothetical protein